MIELCLNMADEELLSDFIYQIRTTDKLASKYHIKKDIY